MAEELIAEKLDTVIALLQLAFHDQIERARQQIRSDPVAAAILDHADGEGIEAGQLQARVAEQTKQSSRTVRRRIAALVEQKALVQLGSGPATRYRSTNLI